jgi:hypothetical protein
MMKNYATLGLIALACTAGAAVQANAQTQATDSAAGKKVEKPKQDNFLIGAQATFIEQYLAGFHSPYSGSNSLQSVPQGRLSDTYTLFLGARLGPEVEAYVDPETFEGGGISGAVGLAGYTNGDVVRQGAMGQSPTYIARGFVRWTLPTGSGTEHIDKGENQMAGDRPTHRFVFTGGKLADNDLFDVNTYANTTRTQFMNWALINDAAYDYAADTRGYTYGVAGEWIQPTWAARVGSFAMPRVANGIDLDPHIGRSRGDQVELEYHTALIGRKPGGIARLLVYRNLADMGTYAQAIALAEQTDTTPDITATRQNATAKVGVGLNFEQPLGDDGDTGVFGRFGMNDGRTESFAYTEADDHVSLGGQLSGKKWKLPQDHLGVALVSDGLSRSHREYLADGGLGFILGDGRLSYAREDILETYYQRQLGKYVSVALDCQFIANPGYNSDRGPVSVVSARLHAEF